MFKCDICSATFTRKYSAKKHTNSVHAIKKTRIFICFECHIYNLHTVICNIIWNHLMNKARYQGRTNSPPLICRLAMTVALLLFNYILLPKVVVLELVNSHWSMFKKKMLGTILEQHCLNWLMDTRMYYALSDNFHKGEPPFVTIFTIWIGSLRLKYLLEM